MRDFVKTGVGRIRLLPGDNMFRFPLFRTESEAVVICNSKGRCIICEMGEDLWFLANGRSQTPMPEGAD